MLAVTATCLSATAAVADRMAAEQFIRDRFTLPLREGEGTSREPGNRYALLQSRGAFVPQCGICHKAA
jgi:hypothetical protein